MIHAYQIGSCNRYSEVKKTFKEQVESDKCWRWTQYKERAGCPTLLCCHI